MTVAPSYETQVTVIMTVIMRVIMTVMTHLLVITSPWELVLVAHHGVADLV